MKSLFVLVTLLFTMHPAQAVLLPVGMRSAIKGACLNHHRGEPGAVAFCGCVGTKHFRSAKQMPNVARANHDLKWVLAYYTAKDQRAHARLRSDPDNLLAYDAFIGRECRAKVHKS